MKGNETVSNCLNRQCQHSLQHENSATNKKGTTKLQTVKDHQRLSYRAFEILCVLLPHLAPRWTWSVDAHSDILSCFLESGIEKKKCKTIFCPS